MKKVYMLVLFMIMFFGTGLAGTGFCQEISNDEAEQIIQQEKSLRTARTVQATEAADIDDLADVLKERFLTKERAEAWYSTDPNDLKPLVGTTWDFSYTIISTFTDTISFKTNISTTSDGTVMLDCADKYGSTGGVFYMELPVSLGGGRGFAAVIQGSTLVDFYFFKISGDTADGYYQFKVVSDGTYSNTYKMTGFSCQSDIVPLSDADKTYLFNNAVKISCYYINASGTGFGLVKESKTVYYPPANYHGFKRTSCNTAVMTLYVSSMYRSEVYMLTFTSSGKGTYKKGYSNENTHDIDKINLDTIAFDYTGTFEIVDGVCACAAVDPPSLLSVSVSGPLTVNENSSANYTATATFSDGTTSDATSSAVWTETSLYASMDSSVKGKLNAREVSSDNSATITATYTYSGVTKSGSIPVTIIDIPDPITLTSVTVSGSSSSVNENSSAYYIATANFSDGSTQTVTSSATWSVSPTTYANMDTYTKGKLNTLSVSSNQSVTVSAAFTYNGVTKTGTKSVTIVDIPKTLSSVTVSGSSSVNENSSAAYSATAYYSDGTSEVVTSSASWSVSSTTYAEMDSYTKGKLNTKSVSSDQSVTVSAAFTYNGVTKTGTKSVTIVDIPKTLSSVTVSGSSSVNGNSSATYTATAYYSDGTSEVVTSSAAWSVSPTTYANMDPYTKGKLNALSVTSNQSVTVSASYTYNGVTKTGTKLVTIMIDYQPPSITVSGPSSVNENSSATYTATANFSDGTSEVVTSSASWSVSSTTYAEMDFYTKGKLNTKSVTSNQTVTVSAIYTYSGVSKTGTITVSIKDNDIPSFVLRTLPCYIANNKLTVSLDAAPTSSVSSYAVEDTPPVGWTVSNIDNGGIYDSVNKKVKFGPFFDNTARTLTYDVTPPAGETGDKTFSGTASADGPNSIIGGDSVISRCANNHPADADNNFTISIGEVTAYGSAWKKGMEWNVPPNPIPIDYLTRAGAVWKNGENYKYDPNAGTCPSCWVNVTSRSERTIQTASIAVCSMPETYNPSESVSVSITVTPLETVAAYAVEDLVPDGWTVSDISNSGEFDAINNKVKYGPFFDHNIRILTYQITPPATASEAAVFSGIASFDGVNSQITGVRTITQKDTSIIPGDANKNGQLDLGDIIYILQVISGKRD